MTPSRRLLSAIILLYSLVDASTALAQRAALRGAVIDATEAPLPGVTIVVTNRAKGLKREVTTDPEGRFVVPNLAAGVYRLTATLEGFLPQQREEIVVGGEGDLEVRLQLQIGTSESVDVFAPAPATGYVASDSTAATRIPIPLQQLPINVQILTKDFIDDAVITDIADTLKYKGLWGNRDIRSSSMWIRGFNNRVLKRNGVRRDQNWGTASVDRVEVVKGPASLLYGEANPGGTVLYVTKKPVARTFADVSVQAGSHDLYRGTVDLGAPIGGPNGPVLFRLIADRQRSDDYYDGAFVDRWSVNPMLQVRAGSRLQVDFEFEHVQDREQQSSHQLEATHAIYDAPALTLDNLPANPPFSINEVAALTGTSFLTEFFTWGRGPLPARFDAQSRDSELKLRTDWLELTANYRIAGETTARVKVAREITNDEGLEFGSNGTAIILPGGQLGSFDWRGRDNRNQRLTAFGEVTGAYSLGSVRNRYIAGYERRHDRTNSAVHVPPTVVYSPTTGRPLPVKGNRVIMPIADLPLFTFDLAPNSNGFTPRLDTILDRNSLYGFDEVELPGGNWRVLGGLRWEQGKNNPFSAGVLPRNRFNAMIGQLGAVRAFGDDHMAFVNFSQSYLPTTSINPDGQTFDPETGVGFEVGMRNLFAGRRLSTMISIWDNARTGVIQVDRGRTFNDPVRNPNQQTYFEQAGLWRARGVDVEVTYTPEPAVQVMSSLSWTPYAEVVENATRPISEGTRLRYTPKLAGGLWLTWALPALHDVSLFGGVAFQSTTEWDGALEYSLITFEPWSTWDGGVSVKRSINGRTVTFRVLAKNFTDRELTTTFRPQDRRRIVATTSFGLF